MANLQKWANVSAWTDGAFGASAADLNIASFVTGYGVLGSGVVNNSSALDLYVDCSFRCTSISPSTTSLPYLALFLLPLLDDGSTYADGETGSTAVNQPTGSFQVGNAVLRGKASSAQSVAWRGIILPPGSGKLYLLNNSGVTLPSTGSVFKYRTYSETNNG